MSKVLLHIDWYDKKIEAFGNLKKLCECIGYNYHSVKGKKFPIKPNYSMEIIKIEVKKGGRKNNKITPTDID